jgi:hypothetical protein
MGKLFLLLASAIFPLAAHAYLPPAFYLYEHIAEPRAKSSSPSLQISISRPMGAGTEETIGSLFIPAWEPSQGGWPALSLLFTGDSDKLIQSVASFGIPVAKEQDLMRAKPEQISAMKEIPRPFYRTDKRMGLERYRQTYAWVHKEGERAVWVEKDTYLPLKIQGPCPAEVAELSWAKAGEDKCELEFRNVFAARRGNPQNSRLAIWKDGNPVLFFSFERVIPAKKDAAPKTPKDSGLPANIQAIADIFLH